MTGPFPGFPVPLVGDDVSELIEAHRDELPFSDQITTADPPAHTDQRALLMRLITPKRLKENEAFMWRLADRQLDTFLARGEGEFISGFAGPFTLLVIADLLGVPDDDHAGVRRRAPAPSRERRRRREHRRRHDGAQAARVPLRAVLDVRRGPPPQPRDDVLTGLATATFPDGSTPEVIDVVRVAANLFAAGQETTVRLLSAALKLIAEDPDLQQLLRDERERIPNFIEETLRMESPVKGDFRLSRGADDGRRRRSPGRYDGDGVERAPRTATRAGSTTRRRSRSTGPTPASTSRSGAGVHTCPGAPLARAEARVSIERLLDRTTDIRISEHAHGPADARSYQYVPTFILRGLTRLHLEFTPADGEGSMKVAVDADRCRGHGVCWSLCPEVFTLLDDGYSVVEVSEVPPEFEDAVRAAVNQCPEHAITAEE